ncbi:MAG: transcriptional repressor LexA [Gemmatimonadaceae bacterium]
MTEPLSPIERRVYHYLIDFLAQHTYQPSVREIARRFEIGSTKTVAGILQAIADKGYIERSPARSRGVHLLGYSAIGGVQPIPLYAAVHGGVPTLRSDDVLRYVAIDRSLVTADESFLLALGDDAMSGQGLYNGDLVLVDPSARARDGDLVAVRIAQDYVVRTVEHRGPVIALAGASTEPAHILLDRDSDFSVLGVIAAVLRQTREGGRTTDGDRAAGT